jgi:hypothetical protein
MKKLYLFLFLFLFSNFVFSQNKKARTNFRTTRSIKRKPIGYKTVKKQLTFINSNGVDLHIGDKYKGGKIWKLYLNYFNDTFLLVIYPAEKNNLNNFVYDKYADDSSYGYEYIAGFHQLQTFFKSGLINENNCNCDWTNDLWNINFKTDSVTYLMKASDLINLPDSDYYLNAYSFEEKADFTQFRYKNDSNINCYFVPVQRFTLRRSREE